MKIVGLIVLALIASSCGNPVQLSEAQLKLKARELLEKIDFLVQEKDLLTEQRNQIYSHVLDSADKISLYVGEHLKIVETKEILGRGTLNGKNVKKCKEVYDKVLFWTTGNLKQSFYEIATPELHAIRFSLLLLESQLEMMEGELEKKLDYILEKCVEESSDCKITGAFPKDIEDLEEYVETTKLTLSTLIDKSLEDVKTNILPNEVENSFNEVDQCFKNAQ